MLVEHLVLMGVGALGWWALPSARSGPRGPARASLAVATALLVAWHVPFLFAAATVTGPLHAAMHLSYLATGALLVVGVTSLSPFGRLLAYVAANGVMVPWALAAAVGAVVYPGYPAGQSQLVGVAMYLGMQAAILVWLAVRPLAGILQSARAGRIAAVVATVMVVLAWL